MPGQPHDVFISYHRVTHAAQAQLLHQALTAQGLAVFKDDQSLRDSENWLEQIGQAVLHCRRFVVLLGPRGLERWVGAETSIVLSRHFGAHDATKRPQIVPVLLPGAPELGTLPFLGLLQGVAWPGGEPPPQRLLDTLRRPLADQPDQAETAPPPEALLAPEVCPWVGLAAFQKDQAARFFGRERDVLDALSQLGRVADITNPHDLSGLQLVGQQENPAAPRPAGSTAPYRRWLHIVGGSGSGKSSLMRAGLLPLAEQGALSARTGLDDWLVTRPMLPGRQPVTELARLLCVTLGQDVDELEQKFLRSTNSLGNQLQQWAEREAQAWRARPGASGEPPRCGLLLVIDQFEELFTLADPGQRRQLDGLLHEALTAPDSPLHLVSTCRSDYQHHIPNDLKRLTKLLNTLTSTYTLTPMDAAGLRQAITGPARLGRVQVQPDLLQALLHDADEDPTAALPLVQQTMATLWNQHRRTGLLTLANYRTEGGLAGILGQQADAVLTELARHSPAHRKGGLRLLTSLVRYSPEKRHTRRPREHQAAQRQAGLGDMTRGQKVLDVLSGVVADPAVNRADSGRLRLIVIGQEAGSSELRVDLIHETLTRQLAATAITPAKPCWETLWEAIEHNKDADRLSAALEHEAERWQAGTWISRWWRLAGMFSLWPHLKFRHLANRTERRYIGWSSLKACLQTGLSLLLLGITGHGLWWASTNNMPVTYVYKPVVWGLQLWRLGIDRDGSIPATVAIRGTPPGQPYTMGCLKERDEVHSDGLNITCDQPEEAPRPVDLPHPCAMGVTLVTYEQWDHYAWAMARQGRKVASLPAVDRPRAKLPVTNLSYNDAQAYLAWLRELTNDPGWRLPTEEEWEYAARAPDEPGSKPGPYWWGKLSPRKSDQRPAMANCSSCDPDRPNSTTPVGSYPPNPFGLYDMAGNVWQWTSSTYTDDNKPADPETAKSGRVLRGGSWVNDPEDLRASFRYNDHPDLRYYYFGFRVCRASPINEKLGAGATGR